MNNIFNLVRLANNKQIVVKKFSWGESWAKVVKVEPKGQYGKVYGEIHYSNGNVVTGLIDGAGCYNWYTVEVLDDSIEFSFPYHKKQTRQPRNPR